MTPRRHITITPIYQHVAETQRTSLLAIIFVGLISLIAFTAYQSVKVDRQIGFSQV